MIGQDNQFSTITGADWVRSFAASNAMVNPVKRQIRERFEAKLGFRLPIIPPAPPTTSADAKPSPSAADEFRAPAYMVDGDPTLKVFSDFDAALKAALGARVLSFQWVLRQARANGDEVTVALLRKAYKSLRT